MYNHFNIAGFKYFNITIADFYHYLDIINCILIELECTEAVNMILIHRQNVKSANDLLIAFFLLKFLK